MSSTETHPAQTSPSSAPSGFRESGRRGLAALLAVVALYVALTLPYACTKLNGDEVHFVTLPYLMLGGDYLLSALRAGEFGTAIRVAVESYALAWRYLVRPADAPPDAAASLQKYSAQSSVAGREKPFVFTPDYFVTHRKAGKPLLGFLLNVPALGAAYLLPRDLYTYQRDYIYHAAFLAPRLVAWLAGLAVLLLVWRIVRERCGAEAGIRAALIFAVLPLTTVWSTDLHQDVPLALFLVWYMYLLGKRSWAWAGVVWGLAFATKSQAALALAPLLAEGIWLATQASGWPARGRAIGETVRALAIVVLLGTAVSAPFAHPLANWTEVFSTSATDITEIHDPWTLLYRSPLWMAAGLLALLGLKLLDDARDSFDRLHIFFLAVGAFFYFFHDYRSYMFIPSLAILAGSYFRPRTAHLLAGVLLVISLAGLHSPYLTSRRLLYKWLNQPGAPQTIEEIERLPGIGSIRAEEQAAPAQPVAPTR